MATVSTFHYCKIMGITTLCTLAKIVTLFLCTLKRTSSLKTNKQKNKNCYFGSLYLKKTSSLKTNKQRNKEWI